MRVETYKQFGGRIPELAALRHVAIHHRVLCRQTSAPPSEAMLFGIAGGVSAAYTVREREDLTPEAVIGLGPRGRARPGEVLQALSVRMGLPATFRHTLDPARAEGTLERSLEQGDPVIVFLSRGGVQNLAEPDALSAVAADVAVVYGLTDGVAELSDVSPWPVRISADALARARGADPTLQRLAVVIGAPASPVDLPKAVEAGLRACWDRMLDPPHPKSSFGLPALRRLAAVIAATGDVDGWPRLFAPGEPLLRALTSLFSAIELGGMGGGGGRALFADFLREASQVLQGPDFTEIASRYDALAVQWAALAAAALPGGDTGLGEIGDLLRAREACTRSAEMDAPEALRTATVRLRTIEKEFAQDFPLDGGGRVALLTELQEKISSLVTEEEATVRALRMAAR